MKSNETEALEPQMFFVETYLCYNVLLQLDLLMAHLLCNLLYFPQYTLF